MGWRAAQWAHQQGGLKHSRVILLDAAWSCLDDTGFLDRDREWLASKCELSLRSLERHLPSLEKLNFLVWNGEGFRLPAYLLASGMFGSVRQNGGDKMSDNLSAKMAALNRKDSFESFDNPPTPLAGGKVHRMRRRGEIEYQPLMDFDSYLCEMCEVPHIWRTDEVYASPFREKLACPEFRAQLKVVRG